MTDRVSGGQPRSFHARPRQPSPSDRRAVPNVRSIRIERRDIRRVVAAALSAVVPGLGQALNGRRRLALALAVPVILVIAVAGVAVATTRPAMLVAWLVRPEVISTLLTLNLVLLAWRL